MDKFEYLTKKRLIQHLKKVEKQCNKSMEVAQILACALIRENPENPLVVSANKILSEENIIGINNMVEDNIDLKYIDNLSRESRET